MRTAEACCQSSRVIRFAKNGGFLTPPLWPVELQGAVWVKLLSDRLRDCPLSSGVPGSIIIEVTTSNPFELGRLFGHRWRGALAANHQRLSVLYPCPESDIEF